MAAAAPSVGMPGGTDSWLVFHAGRGSYEPLLRQGVRIFERRGAILHSKTALIDGVWATVGSTNLEWPSFLHNHELNVVVLGTGFGAELQGLFERDRRRGQQAEPHGLVEHGGSVVGGFHRAGRWSREVRGLRTPRRYGLNGAGCRAAAGRRPRRSRRCPATTAR